MVKRRVGAGCVMLYGINADDLSAARSGQAKGGGEKKVKSRATGNKTGGIIVPLHDKDGVPSAASASVPYPCVRSQASKMPPIISKPIPTNLNRKHPSNSQLLTIERTNM